MVILVASGTSTVLRRHAFAFAFTQHQRLIRIEMQMSEYDQQLIKIDVDQATQISAIVMQPADAIACYVFAHGAGAGMTHKIMEGIANGLFERRIASLRYQFPYMEKGSKRPDPPRVAHAAVRAATAEAQQLFAHMPLIAGGKSFGGRMTSQTQAIRPLPGVVGLLFLGFPLHPAGKPSIERGEHLSDVHVPMLLVQGTRDKLAELPLLDTMSRKLGRLATLHLLPDADHSFHVPKRSGRSDSDVMEDVLDAVARWVHAIKL